MGLLLQFYEEVKGSPDITYVSEVWLPEVSWVSYHCFSSKFKVARWAFAGPIPPSLSITYDAINKDLEKLPP